MGEEASRFRQRADYCRELANGTSDVEAGRTLQEMADDLESEAERLDAAEENLPREIIGPNQIATSVRFPPKNGHSN